LSFKKIISNKKFTFFYFGNLVATLLAMISQLLIPKIIDVEQFGVYKTFTLYLAFTSLFHFGYKDGLYIWFCNKRDELKSKKEIFSSVLFLQQILITSLLLLISLFFENQIKLMIRLLAFATLFNIGYTFFEIYYQSLKIFKPTVYFKFFKEISFFIAIITLYTLEISITAFSLIEIVVAISFITTLCYWFYSKWHFFRFKEIKQYLQEIKDIYKNGFHLLIGNFTHQVSANLDKLFISSFFTSQVFAIYAFGATFFILANVLLTSISTFLLPYLFDEKIKESLSYTRLINIPFKLFPIYIIYFFLVIFIVNNYFLEYTDSLKYFAALNLALVMNISVSILQTNFLKSLYLEKIYSKINSILLIVLFLLLLIIYLFNLNLLLVPIIVSFSFLLRFTINDFYIKRKLNLKFFSLNSFLWLLLIIILYFMGLNYTL
jgi:O-antigen/teichoic acid export membrane protein